MRRGVLLAASLAAFTLFVYAGHVPTEFVYDDRDGVQENPVVNGELPWTAAFIRDFWGRDAKHTVATYRPVPVLVSRAAYAIGGGKPFAFRVTSITLHLLVIWAVLIVMGSLVGLTPNPSHFAAQNERGAEATLGPAAIFIATALFAVCAATSEAVLCVVGSADMLCALGAVIGLMAHRRRGWPSAIGAGAAFLFALGSKESGVMAPVAWLAFDLLLPPEAKLKERLPRFALYGALMVPYLIARKHALGALLLPWTNGPLRNPLVTVDFFHRQLGAANIFVTKYLPGIVIPWRRMFDCSANACGPASASDPIAWLGLALWLCLLAAPFLLRKRAPLVAAGIAWFVLFFLPGSNFLVPGPTIYGERLLYLPSIGLFLAIVVGAQRLVWPHLPFKEGVFGLREHVSGFSRVLVSFVLLLNAFEVFFERSREWSSNRELAQSGLRYARDSAIVQVNLAVEARPLKDYPAVERHARRAIEIDPREMPPHRELAAALFATGRLEEARREFETAYAIRQDEVLIFDYGNFLGKTKEYSQGVAIVDRYLAEHPNHPQLVALADKLRQAAERSTPGTAP